MRKTKTTSYLALGYYSKFLTPSSFPSFISKSGANTCVDSVDTTKTMWLHCLQVGRSWIPGSFLFSFSDQCPLYFPGPSKHSICVWGGKWWNSRRLSSNFWWNLTPCVAWFSGRMNLLRWQCQFWKLCSQSSQYTSGKGQNGCFNFRLDYIEPSLGFFVFFEYALKSQSCRTGMQRYICARA